MVSGQSVALGGKMLISHGLRAVGVSSAIAMLWCLPANADDADVQALKQEVAALQKKLNVLEKQEQVDRAQQQAAIQSWETVTSGKDGKDGGDPPKLFGAKITFGGFVDLTGIYRDKDMVQSVGTSFQKIPFPNTEQAHVNELRGTAQHSRISLLAEGNISDHEKWAGYVESDFLAAAPTSNSTETNSYIPRMRQFYGTYDNTRDGWHFLAGQSWSLVTMFKEGLIPRKENIPIVIDAQYLPGFDFLRTPEIRIVKDWDKKVWLGLEASSPQAIFGGNLDGTPVAFGAPPATIITSFPCNSNLNNALLNSGKAQGCTLDFMPDFSAKLAVDPGWGHYEIFGLARGFRDRVSLPGVAGTNQNNETFGYSGGGGAILPIWGDKLQLQANVLYGQGIGRYDAAQLPDFTVAGGIGNADVAALTGFSVMGGITSHNAIPQLDLYAYAGENHVFNHVTNGNGFGDGIINNTQCFVNPGLAGQPANCAAEINDVWQVTGGFWHSLYDGDKGKAVWGMQDSFTVDTTPIPAAGKGDKESASLNTAMMVFRFYPKYGQLIGTKP